jgi:SOS-response transcriptional repressor LexA
MFANANKTSKKMNESDNIMSPFEQNIIERVRSVRLRVAGPRGKASFASMLGISPSTYNYYEKSRIPPAGILAEIHSKFDVDLHWLLLGEEEASVSKSEPSSKLSIKLDELLSKSPELAGPAAAFLDLLVAHAEKKSAPPSDEHPRLIPIFSRTAAGVAQFWSLSEIPDIETIKREKPGHTAEDAPLSSEISGLADSEETPDRVHLIYLNEPLESGVSAFIDCPNLWRRHPDACAFHVNGDSMSSRYNDGDIVVVSTQTPPHQGQPVVIHLKVQIGPTCKIYRKEGENIHLIPLHPSYSPQVFPADDVLWVFPVVASVRTTES